MLSRIDTKEDYYEKAVAAKESGPLVACDGLRLSRPPIIVIGMHRSGTTMIVDALSNMGVFMGWDVQGDLEALYFLRRNEKILRMCNGSWEFPRAIDALLRDESLRNVVLEKLKTDLCSKAFHGYLGPLRWLKTRVVGQLQFPWGWKDPRNTFLLPLWLQLFPDARVVHVYRNGVDVANSLRNRNSSWELHGVAHSRARGGGAIFNAVRRKFSAPSSLVNPGHAVHDFFDPLKKYSRLVVNQSTNLDFGFALWSEYVARAFKETKRLSDNILHIRYENFLAEPEEHAAHLACFCGVDPSKGRKWAAKVDAGRRFAFRGSSELRDFYERVKDHKWMKKLDY